MLLKFENTGLRSFVNFLGQLGIIPVKVRFDNSRLRYATSWLA